MTAPPFRCSTDSAVTGVAGAVPSEIGTRTGCSETRARKLLNEPTPTLTLATLERLASAVGYELVLVKKRVRLDW